MIFLQFKQAIILGLVIYIGFAHLALAVSPFKGDGGGVPYLGGYDANGARSQDAGWIYRADLRGTKK